MLCSSLHHSPEYLGLCILLVSSTLLLLYYTVCYSRSPGVRRSNRHSRSVHIASIVPFRIEAQDVSQNLLCNTISKQCQYLSALFTRLILLSKHLPLQNICSSATISGSSNSLILNCKKDKSTNFFRHDISSSSLAFTLFSSFSYSFEIFSFVSLRSLSLATDSHDTSI